MAEAQGLCSGKTENVGKGQNCLDEVLDVRLGILYFILVAVVSPWRLFRQENAHWELCIKKRKSQNQGNQVGGY